MKKRLLSMVMLFCMTLSLLPSAALAAPEDETAEPVPVRVAVPEKETAALQENTSPEEDLFYQYMLRRAEQERARGSVSLFSTETDKDYRAREKLNDGEKLAYDALLKYVKEVANGTRLSTVFLITPENLNVKYGPWTTTDLDVSNIYSSDAQYALLEKMYLIYDPVTETYSTGIDLIKVVQALMYDCPYELYWFDKTSLYNIDYAPCFNYDWKDGALYFSDGSNLPGGDEPAGIEVSMPVMACYSATNTTGTYLMSEHKVKVDSAVTNAKEIVTTNAGKSDYEKLVAYKDAICELVDYDDDARINPDPYRDSYQLISVFDDNPDTKVVCEGYSKAFQYLCDISTFDSNLVQCYSVTGTMSGGTGGGRHMWNIVTMPDGVNYLVDVTNVDSGSIGFPNKLFLRGVTMKDDTPTGFSKAIGSKEIIYSYDDGFEEGTYSMLTQWGKSLLTLSANDYGEFQVTYNAAPGYVDEGKTLNTTTVTEYRNGSGDLLTPLYWGKEGDLFSFDGWFKDGETTKTTPEEIRAACTDVVLKAKWTCWVAFDGNGGTPEVTSESGEPGGTVPVPAVSRGTGGEYILDGWYSEKTGGTKELDADAATYPVNASDTLYAQWQAKVTYDGNGGTPATPSEYVLLGDTTVLPAAARDGCAFAGWYTMADGGDYIGAADQTYTVTAPTTLYAHWTCSLTLDANGGKLKNKAGGEADSLTETVPAGTRLSAVKDLPSATWDGNDPAQAGFEFAGWWTMATGGEQVVDTDTAPYNITGDTTLYAHWNSLGFSYLLTYDANGGIISTLPESVQYPETGVTEESAHTFVMDSTVKPTWENHYFRGWGVSSDATTPVTSIEVDGVRGDVATATAYALWLPIEASLEMVVGTTQTLPGMPTEGMTWTSSDAAVAVVCDGIFVARGVGEAIITATSDSSAEVSYYLVTVGPSTDPEPLSTMTAGEDTLDWFIQNMGSAGKKVIVAGTDAGINENKPVLVASYQNGKMLSVEFITTALDSVDVSSDATSVKLFWIDKTSGYLPRCANAEAIFTVSR